ncbi:transglutaminase-like cysteine peptidase [Methylobacterium sp. Leaf112]|uniref:transglutaminase-like cysteine peptidase n=1 Tax=Methylobacterium sp. Leaf112 TaxID=1736258 RepID=UPI0006FCACAF|nr:transglutaminase-like cysteine peptidase [Methylobacterium sp. Leaf112]KQP66102.1 transglutaminase [Methylobacterium sp. Leaf112]
MRIAISKCLEAVTGSSLGRAALLAGLLGGLLAAPVAAPAQTFASLPATPSVIASGPAAKPIAAWVAFCESYAAECAVDRTEPATIALDAATWNTIVSVNRRVNKAIRAVTDMDHLHVADRWDLAGLPRRAMRMTVVIDEKGEGHAVLTLITDRGDFILDNKTNAVQSWRQTGYTFIKRESQDTQAWVSLGRATSPVTTANR